MRQDFLKQYSMLNKKDLVLCAVSGGADSMCLLMWLKALSSDLGFTVAAAHFNHHLRGENADRDENFVRRWCAEHKIPLYVGHGDVRSAAREHGWTIEEAARSLRYAFLDRKALEIGADRIATAHNAEDNAETILMNLVRGTGMEGLTGIAPVRGMLIRPLLTTPRSEIEQYLADNNIPHIEDETNKDLEITRNKIRLQVMPVLREINPAATQCINRTSSILREENRYLTQIAARAAKKCEKGDGSISISREELCALSPIVAKRVLRRMLSYLPVGKKDVTVAHIDSILRLARTSGPSARLNLPNGITVRNIYGRLSLSLMSEGEKLERTPLSPVGQVRVGSFLVTTVVTSHAEPRDGRIILNNDKIHSPVFIDSRAEGDAIALKGRGSRTLKRLMIDEHIPCDDRAAVPVIRVGGRVAAVYPLGIDEKFEPKDGCKQLVIDFYNI